MLTIHRQICKRFKTASGEGFVMFSAVPFVFAIALLFELDIHVYKISWVAWKIVWQD